MRVLVIGNDPHIADPNSDAEKRIREYGELADMLIIFLLLREKVGYAKANYANVFIHVFSGRWSRFIKALWRGKKIIASENFTLLDAQDIEHGLIAWIFSRIYNIPWRLQIHSDIFSPYFVRRRTSNMVRVAIAKFLIPRANCIRVVSKRIRDSLDLRFKNRDLRITVLPIFVDMEQVKNIPVTVDLHKKYPQFDFIILMASRLTKEKNIEMAIEAMREMVKKYPKIGLIIVGSGPEKRKLQQLATGNWQLANNIKFENEVDFKTLISYYKTADLFLLTSLYEGYGRTLIEAAAAGCPIISTDVGIAPEVLEKESIIKVGDVKELANSLIRANSRIVRPAKLSHMVSKQEYLQAYKQSWQKCGKEV